MNRYVLYIHRVGYAIDAETELDAILSTHLFTDINLIKYGCTEYTDFWTYSANYEGDYILIQVELLENLTPIPDNVF